MLKLGIALLARSVVFAVIIEAPDRKPRTISSHLTGLGVEQRGKRVLFGENGAIALQIVSRDTTLIHPFSQAFVPNELSDLYRLVNGGILLMGTSYLVLVDQHIPYLSRFPCLCLMYSRRIQITML